MAKKVMKKKSAGGLKGKQKGSTSAAKRPSTTRTASKVAKKAGENKPKKASGRAAAPTTTKTAKKSPKGKVASVSKKTTKVKTATKKQSTARSGAPAKTKTKTTKTKTTKKTKQAPAATRMNRAKALKFRRLLVDRHAALVASYNTIKGNTRTHGSDGTEDYIDYAVSSYDRDFTLSMSELERRQILLVEEALRRIDRGTFGRCQQCGEQIAERRLEVEPWARHCIRCQELEEQGLLVASEQFSGDDEDESEELAGDDDVENVVEVEDEVEEVDDSDDDDDEIQL